MPKCKNDPQIPSVREAMDLSWTLSKMLHELQCGQRMGEENVCAGADYNPFHDPFAR